MKPSLLQCQVRAIFIGLLWAFPFLVVLLYLAGPAHPAFLSGVAWLAVLFGFPIFIAFVVAVLTGKFDRLAIIALLIPATYGFVTSTHVDWVWHSRHTGTLLGPSLPLDLLTVIVVVILAFVGVALKRRAVPAGEAELSARESRSLTRCLWWDIGILAAIATVLLTIDAAKIRHESDPQVIMETQKEILNSPTASEAEKLRAIMRLGFRRAPELHDLLRRAMSDPSPNVRLAAAAGLLQQGDDSVLPQLEDRLMQSSRITFTTDEPQVIHKDWLGYGEGEPSTITFAVGLYGVRDSKAVPILKRLLSSSDLDVQNGAAQALEYIKLQSHPPYLH